jgi:hypothetical protein
MGSIDSNPTRALKGRFIDYDSFIAGVIVAFFVFAVVLFLTK